MVPLSTPCLRLMALSLETSDLGIYDMPKHLLSLFPLLNGNIRRHLIVFGGGIEVYIQRVLGLPDNSN